MDELQERSTHEIESIPECVNSALSSLESVLSILFKNIDKDTQELSPKSRLNLENTEIKTNLERIGLIARRIQREIS